MTTVGDATKTPPRATALANQATAAGWAVKMVWGKSETGGDSVSVRVARGLEHYAAIWVDGKFWTALAPFEKMTLTKLKGLVGG